MTTFDRAIKFVLSAEGDISDDPLDPGGLTRYGISQRAHPDIDVAHLTKAKAINIYRTRYWATYLDRLPPPVAVAVFDTGVNLGIRPAIRLLQDALDVTIDGIVGPQTLAAAYRLDKDVFLTNYCAKRGIYYAHLGASFDRYGYGWLRRLFALAAYCRTLPA